MTPIPIPPEAVEAPATHHLRNDKDDPGAVLDMEHPRVAKAYMDEARQLLTAAAPMIVKAWLRERARLLHEAARADAALGFEGSAGAHEGAAIVLDQQADVFELKPREPRRIDPEAT